ncbi:DUF3365 domain-containing protein [Belliella kenyensis]|uniref:DUF3365 domain-containing protein n=1 Tax=Belliella kenyensis TaxID=1472724 RepID=A0ABV8ERU1_9BACT|nr:DUF3365 domain-containing protein [Belliella kenyensis]MCH7402626.1 DUF3365 domain-containing protein [Belliella kenyensis]MDN3603424.1 DUF3365 domain-containing protein [Belliella kenyensis]
MRNISYLLTILILSISCNSNERISREVFEDVNRSMEVKKLNESQILDAAMKWGEEISNAAQTELISTLQKAIEEQGVADAVSFCNIEALPILSKVSEKYHVQIRRASKDYRNPDDKPKDYEMNILDAYAYNAEEGIKNEPNIQKLENGEVLLFTKAIQIPNSLCLNCHGTPKEDISDATLRVIDELYPEDEAKGHKIGDLRGMWSIRIPRSEVIKKL